MVPDTSAARCFEKEPNMPLGLIDPVLEKTRSGNIARIVAKAVYGAHPQDQCPFVLSKLAQHICGANVVRVIISESLQASDVTDRPYRCSADLPHAFSDLIGHGKQLILLLIEEQVVVAKMRAAHVPLEFLCFQMKGEHVRKQSVESS